MCSTSRSTKKTRPNWSRSLPRWSRPSAPSTSKTSRRRTAFYVERELRKRLKIPVFHDDQHGTAITVGAAVLNALKVVNKAPGQVKLVTSGAGAAALACLNLLLKLGIQRENVYVTDLAGVVYEGRTELMDEDKIQFAQKTDARSLSEVIEGADLFLGLSAGGVLKKEMVAKMAGPPHHPGAGQPESGNLA